MFRKSLTTLLLFGLGQIIFIFDSLHKNSYRYLIILMNPIKARTVEQYDWCDLI